MAMTLSLTSTATSVASLGENYPTETVIITIPSPYHSGGLSQTTEHLLIAAGSIGTLSPTWYVNWNLLNVR